MGRNCSRRYPLHDDSGVSLVEAAVAIIVLGVVLVGLFPLVLDSVRLSVQNSEVAQANRIVASQLDIARSSLEGSACVEESGSSLVLESVDSTKFTGIRRVTCAGKLATVTVKVSRVAAPAVVSATATTKVVTADA